MAARAVTLELPAPLYDHFLSRAERAHRSLEAELLDTVATVAADEEELSDEVTKALADLDLMSDEELWLCRPESPLRRGQIAARSPQFKTAK